MLRPLVVAIALLTPSLALAEAAKAEDVVDVDEAEEEAEAIVAPAPSAPPPPIETMMPPPTAGEMVAPLIKTMLMLGVVLLLVWLTLAKGMGKLVEKAQAGKRVRVIERVALDARRSLFLVEVDGKHMLIGGGDVQKVAELDHNAPQQKLERQGLFDKVLATTKKQDDVAASSSSTASTTTTETSA